MSEPLEPSHADSAAFSGVSLRASAATSVVLAVIAARTALSLVKGTGSAHERLRARQLVESSIATWLRGGQLDGTTLRPRR